MSTNLFYSNKYQYSKQELYLHVQRTKFFVLCNRENRIFRCGNSFWSQGKVKEINVSRGLILSYHMSSASRTNVLFGHCV